MQLYRSMGKNEIAEKYVHKYSYTSTIFLQIIVDYELKFNRNLMRSYEKRDLLESLYSHEIYLLIDKNVNL